MDTAEPASDSLGPRYAPDDPTLPKPWMGLIDGSTGLLYYWNPETNITQYEKPAALPPPLPPGPPPAAATPKLAPIPVAQQQQQQQDVSPNRMLGQQGSLLMQTTQHQGQQMVQLPQQHGQLLTLQQPAVSQQHQSQTQVSQNGQQLGSQVGQTLLPPRQLTPQLGQRIMHPGQQMTDSLGQQLSQQALQQRMLQTGQSMPHQTVQQVPQQQGSQIPHSQGHPFMHQQLPYFAYQQTRPPQGPHSIPNQHTVQAQQFVPSQEHRTGFSHGEDFDRQQANKIGYSSSQIQQPCTSSVQSLQDGTNSTQMAQMGQMGQVQQFGSGQVNLQHPTSLGQYSERGCEFIHQKHGPRFQNLSNPTEVQNQQHDVGPTGLKIGYEVDDSLRNRMGSECYFNASKELAMNLQQPKLAAIPMSRNQQDMRLGIPLQNTNPGNAAGLNAVVGHNMQNFVNHAKDGSAYPNNPLIRNPSTVFGSSDNTNLSPAEIYRQQHEVTATGDNVPPPFMTFEATGFPPEILREISIAGFSSPTPIQAQTWPIALQNRDIVAIAKTGSGKTLGYLLPAFIHLRRCHNDPTCGPTVLVLAPTRELATQIQDEVIKFGRSSRVSCTCLYGGAPRALQIKELDRGADIVVATPGRLNDILDSKKIDFGQISLLVLDEADRMLDMGFEPQIRKIVNEIPPRRQTLMYTATWPKEVRKIANDLLVNPVQVNIGSVDELSANKSITQYVEVVPQMEKQRRLEQIIRSQDRGAKVIVFCSTKRLCDQLARSIGRNFGAAAIHGDKSQGERDWVLNQFRSGKSPILVATDVAARGLDIKDIRVVINYDFPTGIEDYVHRIGRTGRAGATGVAYTFFSEQDWKYAADLIKVLEGANQHVPPEVRQLAMHGGPNFNRDRSGMNRFDAGGSGGRWDFGRRGGMRDGGFSGRGGMRDGGFSGHGGMRDSNFGGRSGFRDGGFGGRAGAVDSSASGYGGRNDFYSGRGNRGRGFSGWDRNGRGSNDRNSKMEGRGRGRARGRFDNRRDFVDRSRGRSYSSSPERVRTWGYGSRSRSRSHSWSRSRSHSSSRSRSRSRGRGHGRGCSRSRSRSYDRYESSREREFDEKNAIVPAFEGPPPFPATEAPPSFTAFEGPPESRMSPMSPGTQNNAFMGAELAVQPPMANPTVLGHSEAVSSSSLG